MKTAPKGSAFWAARLEGSQGSTHGVGPRQASGEALGAVLPSFDAFSLIYAARSRSSPTTSRRQTLKGIGRLPRWQ